MKKSPWPKVLATKGVFMDLQEITDELVLIVTQYGLDVIGALVILLIGYIVSKRVPTILTNIMNKRGIDPTVSGFLGSLTRFVILAITLLLVLAQFGVQTASLIAVLGAAGLAIGLGNVNTENVADHHLGVAVDDLSYLIG